MVLISTIGLIMSSRGICLVRDLDNRICGKTCTNGIKCNYHLESRSQNEMAEERQLSQFAIKIKKDRKRRANLLDFLHKFKRQPSFTLKDCVICLENISDEEFVKTKCNHSFHSGCIKNWLRTNGSCPLCRNKLI